MNLQSCASILLQNRPAKGQSTQQNEWLYFSDPLEEIVAHSPSDVLPCLEKIQSKQAEGYYLAGYMAYEAAAGLNAAMAASLEKAEKYKAWSDYPLVWFGVYKTAERVSLDEIQRCTPSDSPGSSELKLRWQPDISLESYAHSIQTIKNEISAGNSYQVNYTFRMLSAFENDPLTFFLKLQGAQSSHYSAYLNLGDMHICSASPELFFTLKSGQLHTRPMKGTINRGLHTAQDVSRKQWLFESEKNRAENLMIVDMLRNDLGQVAESGSVQVDELFSIETYPTVFQMTSSISARTNSSAVDVLKHMFPCASITGAPKISTMRIIAELENSPRGIYTGSIGFISPEGEAQFNVAIRTVVVDIKRKQACYGVGGGIVWDSTVKDEYQECKIKAEILTREPPALKLLESMRLDTSGEIVLLHEHLTRLKAGCAYFGFKYCEQDILEYLRKVQDAHRGTASKLRLLLDAEGHPYLDVQPLGSKINQLVRVSDHSSNTQSRFIYHKTTNRRFYDKLLAEYKAEDVIIINVDGRVTESCSANVVISKNGRLLTPALDCGLLNGTLRKVLLDRGEIEEASITRQELFEAEAVYLLNSVRGWMQLVPCGENTFRIEAENIPTFN